MSGRTYLSIGDVLTLLRQEFPDVTISKIRFLESQGLVNPERTPSGYRKFYDHDVERLRWVLRQQREHFLPLKVIKDRLDDDLTGPEPTVGPSGGRSEVEAPGSAVTAHRVEAERPLAEPSHVDAGAATVVAAGATARAGGHVRVADRTEDPVLVGHRVQVGSGTAVTGVETTGGTTTGRPGERPTLPGMAGTSGSSANGPGTLTASLDPSHRAPVVDEPAGSLPADSPPAVAHAPAAAKGDGDAPPRSRARRTGSAPAGSAAAGESGVPAPAPARAPAPAPAEAAPPTSPVVPASVDLNGVSLSLGELAAASGLEPEVLAELQEYGLLRPMNVAGEEFFDEESLAVATLAAAFAQFGIEPRHLRLYKIAAEREAGFVEQIVLPLVRQRNPEARVRARETADELARLGQQLRGSLLRGSLRDLLNG